MDNTKRIQVSLLLIRVSAGIFLGLWATLKFHHPEWQRNIFEGYYNISFFKVTDGLSYFLGLIQLLIVLAFVTGFKRNWTYLIIALMSAAGVVGSLGSLVEYYEYPKNLMLASIPTLGALIALFVMRDMDNLFSLSARKKS